MSNQIINNIERYLNDCSTSLGDVTFLGSAAEINTIDDIEALMYGTLPIDVNDISEQIREYIAQHCESYIRSIYKYANISNLVKKNILSSDDDLNVNVSTHDDGFLLCIDFASMFGNDDFYNYHQGLSFFSVLRDNIVIVHLSEHTELHIDSWKSILLAAFK